MKEHQLRNVRLLKSEKLIVADSKFFFICEHSLSTGRRFRDMCHKQLNNHPEDESTINTFITSRHK